MAEEIKSILDRLNKLESKVTEIERINKLALEEEIRKNILLVIKTNVLESEVRLLKDKVKALSSVS